MELHDSRPSYPKMAPTVTVKCNYSVFQSLFCKWFVGHIGVCPAELSRDLLPYIFYHMFILFFMFYVYFSMLVPYVFVLWLSPVQYHVHQYCKVLRAFLG